MDEKRRGIRHKGEMGDVSKIFGQNVKFFREQAGLSQGELAEKIGGSCSKTTVSLWETGSTWPSRKYVRILAKILEVQEEDLFSPIHGPTKILVKQAIEALKEVFHL